MKKKLIFFILVILIILLLIILALFIINKNNTKNQVIFENNIKLFVEISKTQKQWETGLMFRKNLDKNKAMLFISDNEKIRNFWMKNTLIPLDMIFIDKNLNIINIIENAQPCTKEPCQAYSSSKPAKYVIETNAGFAKENNITQGQKISII